MKEFLKKYRKLIMQICVVLILVGAFFGGCSYLNRTLDLEDDNVIEEAVENKIKDYSGLDIDLTPESPEK